MVSKSFRNGAPVYFCEVCGFGYDKLENGEVCEEFCDTHGSSSPEIVKKATHRPMVRLMSIAKYSFIQSAQKQELVSKQN